MKQIKIILLLSLFFVFPLGNSYLFASDIGDCLELEKLKAKNEGITSKDTQEIALKICRIRARLGFTTENAKNFNICMKNERARDKEDRKITYSELVENSIEICSDQLEAKKEIEAEIARQEAEEHKKKIRQKRIENQRIEEEKELERELKKIENKEDDDYYLGPIGWFMGLGIGTSSATVQFPKVPVDLFGFDDAFEGNSFTYNNIGTSLLVGYRNEQTRFYGELNVGPTLTGGIQQTSQNGFNHDYTDLDVSILSFKVDYFFSNSSKSLFVGAGFSNLRANLIHGEKDTRSVWTYNGREEYIDTIVMTGTFPVAKIGWIWDSQKSGVQANASLEISYTHIFGIAKGTGNFSIISGSGLSSNLSANGPYFGEFETSLSGFVAMLFNIYY